MVSILDKCKNIPILAAFITSFGTRSIQSLGGVIINAVIARHLSREQFGEYFIVLAVASIVATFILMGANTVILRISAGKGAAVAFREMSRMALSMLVVSCIVYITYFSGIGESLMSIFGLVVSPNLKYAVAALAAAVAIQSLMHDYYRGLGKLSVASAVANYGAMGSIGYGVISIIAFSCALSLLLLLDIHMTLLQIIWVGAVIGAFVATGGWVAERRRIRHMCAHTHADGHVNRRKGERIALLLTALLAIVLNQMDIYTISVHFSHAQVGIYCAAQRLSLLVLLPLMIITAFFQPRSARLFADGDTKSLSSVSRAFTTVLLLMGAIALLIFIIAGKPVMGLVYGSAYREGAMILVLKAAGSVALLGTGLANAVFTTTGNERILVLVGMLGAGLFGLVTLVWTPASMEQVEHYTPACWH